MSFDIDLIDPTVAPGVSVPAINGISLNEAYEIVTEIIKCKDDIKSIDIVEFNPLKDVDNITKNIAQTIYNKIVDGIN